MAVQAGLRYICSGCHVAKDVFVDTDHAPSIRENLPEGWLSGRWTSRERSLVVACPECAVPMRHAERADQEWKLKRRNATLAQFPQLESGYVEIPRDWIDAYDKQNPRPNLWPKWAK